MARTNERKLQALVRQSRSFGESRRQRLSTYRIAKQYTFHAGHHLAGLPEGHKCRNPHGHTFTAEVIVGSDVLVPPGFVTDFGDLAPFGAYIDAELDHRDLNQVLDFPPTSEAIAEVLALWFLDNLQSRIHGRLLAVRVSETPTSWAEYTVGTRP
jgi:6-pyruvoyltetrahydropterin/6-carboxytetrahydropterin synthase